MKPFIYKFLLIIITIILSACENKKVLSQSASSAKPYKAGVVLSFDDAYVDEWFEADQTLKKYAWKASFCTCRIDSIGAPQLSKLLQMQKNGHEIAGHGYHHFNAVKYVAANGIDNYIKAEIDPMLASMKRLSLNVTSFAYPYGERSKELDEALAPKFNIIRGRAFCGDVPEKEGCYFRDTKYMYAFDIDNNHVHFSIPYLLELLDYAREKNKILILCGHKPVNELTDNYQIKIETLEFVCKYIKQNNMKFYTLSDLGNLIRKE